MDINKEVNLKFIKNFNKISVAKICKDLGIDKSNLYRGNASADSYKKVKEEIIKRFKELEN